MADVGWLAASRWSRGNGSPDEPQAVGRSAVVAVLGKQAGHPVENLPEEWGSQRNVRLHRPQPGPDRAPEAGPEGVARVRIVAAGTFMRPLRYDPAAR
jgi:hypothetical protein